jgi:hypothetical protein
MRWAGHTARMGEMRTECKIPVDKSEGEKPPGKHKPRKRNNTELNLQEIALECEQRIHLAEDRERRGALLRR